MWGWRRRRRKGDDDRAGRKKGVFYVTAVARLSKMGEGLFWAALFSEAAKASVPVFFSSTPKEEEKGEKMLLWKDATLGPVRGRESGSGALLFLRIPLLLLHALFASNAPSRSL